MINNSHDRWNVPTFPVHARLPVTNRELVVLWLVLVIDRNKIVVSHFVTNHVKTWPAGTQLHAVEAWPAGTQLNALRSGLISAPLRRTCVVEFRQLLRTHLCCPETELTSTAVAHMTNVQPGLHDKSTQRIACCEKMAALSPGSQICHTKNKHQLSIMNPNI